MGFLKTIEFKVGSLVLGIGGIIAFMSMQVSDDPTLLSSTKKAWFLIPNAGGLIKKSAIRSAGIPMGMIKDIRLQDGVARIDITVRSDVPLTTSTYVEIKSMGILGDKHVEIVGGSLQDPPIPDGGQILNVKDQGSLDSLIGQVSAVAGNLKAVSESLKESTSGDGTRNHILGRVISNIERLTRDLSEMTAENKGKIGEIINQVRNVTGTLNDLVSDEGETGFKKTWKNSMERIDHTMKNIDEMVAKVHRGEGTIGKLVNDDTTVEELNTAIQGVSSLVDSASKISTGFDFHGEYLSGVNATKTSIGIQIQPGLDRFYYLGIVNDPAGVVEKQTTDISSGGSSTSTDQKITYYNKTKFTAVFGKNFWDWTLRAGLIESTGGFGIDYHMLNNRLTTSLEAIDLGNGNVRGIIKYQFPYGIYLHGGIVDAFDRVNSRAGFIGAGLYLTNDDLKLLLSKAPI